MCFNDNKSLIVYVNYALNNKSLIMYINHALLGFYLRQTKIHKCYISKMSLQEYNFVANNIKQMPSVIKTKI